MKTNITIITTRGFNIEDHQNQKTSKRWYGKTAGAVKPDDDNAIS